MNCRFLLVEFANGSLECDLEAVAIGGLHRSPRVAYPLSAGDIVLEQRIFGVFAVIRQINHFRCYKSKWTIFSNQVVL